MATLKLEAVTVHNGRSYALNADPATTVGTLARYLAQQNAHIEASTLEAAYPVQPEQLLRDIGLQGGDRLVIFNQAIKQADMPPPLRPGDPLLKFTTGQFEVNANGKKQILIGKPDDTKQITPDVDLRYFVPDDAMQYVSRECLRLEFDAESQNWQATRLGQTRIMIDAVLLDDAAHTLRPSQQIRFYRASDDPAKTQAIGEMTLTVETVPEQSNRVYFKTGSQALQVCIGTEQHQQMLKVSENLQVGQVADALARHNRLTLMPDAQLYLVRLIPPESAVSDITVPEGGYLYTTQIVTQATNSLLLHDVHNRERVYTLTASLEDRNLILGCRQQPRVADPSLDVDLYDALIIRGHDPRLLTNISHQQGYIRYNAAEKSWWLHVDDGARAPLYLNNTRVTNRAAMQLLSGDVITLGPNINHYYARLEVEITTGTR